jgi:hypothetical protein
MQILRSRDALDVLDKNLPVHIADLSGERLAQTKEWIDTAAAHNVDIRVYALLLVMNKLAAPWQIIRLALKMAASDDEIRVAATPYGIAVTIALHDLSFLTACLRTDIRRGHFENVGEPLKILHDGVRGLRTELDLSADQPWRRQLAAVRAEVSAAMENQIVAVPGRVHRLLRPRARGEGAALDVNEVAEVEALIDLVNACRTYAAEVAVNEATQRVHSQLQHYLDTGLAPLLEGLRQAGSAERAFRQAQVDAAVRFAAKIFGSEYAAVLLKAADVAGQGADPKAAKA